MSDFIGFAIFVVALVTVSKIFSDHRIRMKLIDKGLVDDKVNLFLKERSEIGLPSSLKWGMVLIAIGLAIIIGQLVRHDLREEVTASAIFIMSGLALVIYYGISSRILRKTDNPS